MPLSEHEQRMLDQIERALYAEDPKFASTVRGGRLRGPHRRRRMQGFAVFGLGLILLVGGVALPVPLVATLIIGVLGFLVMFGGALLIWLAFRAGQQDGESDEEDDSPDASSSHPSGGGSATNSEGSGRNTRRQRQAHPSSRKPPKSSFAQRMEERLRKRFDQ